jgi:hypothetical protein
VCTGWAYGPRVFLHVAAIENLFAARGAVYRSQRLAGQVFGPQGDGDPSPGQQLVIRAMKHALHGLRFMGAARVNLSDVDAICLAACGVEERGRHLSVEHKLGAAAPDARARYDLDRIGDAAVVLDEDDDLLGIACADELESFEGEPYAQDLPQTKMTVEFNAPSCSQQAPVAGSADGSRPRPFLSASRSARSLPAREAALQTE